MTTASDDQIVEALNEHWPDFPYIKFTAADGFMSIAVLSPYEVAAYLEPIIEAHQAKAWEEGEVAGLRNYEQDDLGDFVSNPYRATP